MDWNVEEPSGRAAATAAAVARAAKKWAMNSAWLELTESSSSSG